MVLLCNDMNSFSPVVFQFFFSDINIDMRLKMLCMCRFVMEHEFVSAEKYIVAVIQIIIFGSVKQNVNFQRYIIV